MQEEANKTDAEPRHCEDDDLLHEAPSLKRKKTVTWADDEEGEGTADGNDRLKLREEQEDDRPAVVLVQTHGGAADPLFAGLSQAALLEQAPVPKSEGEPLTREQLLERRLGVYTDLAASYTQELWAAGDELLLRRWDAAKPALAELLTGNRFTEAAARDAVRAAVVEGGLEAAWAAIHSSGSCEAAQPPLPAVEELEDLVLCFHVPDDPAQVESLRQKVVERREAFLSTLAVSGRREASAAAAISRELDAHGAVAALCGRTTRYLLRRTAVTLGRGGGVGASSDGGSVDVDLGVEGGAEAARAVSRQQAQVFLDADGRGFKLRCVGRRDMRVNGEAVGAEKVVPLPHLSLLRVGPVKLLFVVNRAALDRLAKRSAALGVA